MNALILTIGGAIVLALFTALIGPHFVDWTTYRGLFEREASALLRREVRVEGAVDVQILPMPIVSFSDVVVGGEDGAAPLATIGSFSLDLALAPLLRGEYQVTELAIEKAELSLALDAEGQVAWPAGDDDGQSAGPDAERVAIEHFVVSESTLALTDERTGAAIRLEDARFEGDMRSLAGPGRLDGAFWYGGVPHTFRLSTGAATEDGLRFKASLSPADSPRVLEIDANARLEDGVPSVEGGFVMQHMGVPAASAEAEPIGTALPWRMVGTMLADAEGVTVEAFELGVGPEDRRAVMSGSARRSFGAGGTLEVALSARQIDLDRLLSGEDGERLAPPEIVARLVDSFPALASPPESGRIGVEIGGVIVSGAVIGDIRVDALGDNGAWRVDSAAATLPGATDLRAEGSLSLEPGAAAFDGHASIATDTFGSFRNWLAGLGEEGAQLLPSQHGRMEAQAQVSANSGGLILEDLDMTLGGARARGSLSLETNGPIAAKLSLEGLDLDALMAGDGARIASALGGLSRPIDLELSADRLQIGGLDVEDVLLSIGAGGGTLDVREVTVGAIGGIALTARGRVEALATMPDGTLEVSLEGHDLSRLPDIARLAGLATLADALATRAPALGPMRLEGTFTARAGDDATASRLELAGLLNGTEITLEAEHDGRIDTFADGAASLSLQASNADAGVMMEQLGIASLPVDELGPGRFELSLAGTPSEGLEVEALVEAFRTTATLRGTARTVAGAAPILEGEVSVRSEEAASLALALILPVPDADLAGAAALTARMSLAEGTLSLDDLRGEIDGRHVSGRLAFVPGESPRLDGGLSVDRMDLGWLLAGLVGAEQGLVPQDGGQGMAWADQPLSGPALSGLRGKIEVAVERLDIGDGVGIAPVRFDLAMRGNEMSVEKIEGGFAGGVLKGTLVARMQEDEPLLLATLSIEGAQLEEIVWQENGRPVATGTLALSAEAQGTGRTLAGLLGGVVGSGTFTARDGSLRGMNPRAFGSILRAADAGLDLTEERVRAVFAGHLAAGELGFTRIEGAFAATAGVVRTRNVAVEGDSATSFASARLDLAPLTVESEWTLSVPSPDGLQGAQPPQVTLLFSGPLSAPDRSLDVSALRGFLTVRAFEQEVERLERLQAEISERERLGRELRLLDERRRRREREVEQAARAAEEARLAREAAAEEGTAEPDPDEASALDTMLDERDEAAEQGAGIDAPVRLFPQEREAGDAPVPLVTPRENAPWSGLRDVLPRSP